MKRERERESKATGHLPGRAGPPGPCQSSPTSARRQRRETAHARPRRHAPPCLPASLRPPRRLTPSPRCRLDPLEPSRSLPPSLSPLIPLPPATERSSSPPLAVATPTGHPTPHRRPRKLRRSSLFLLTKTEGAGSPGWGQLRRSPPRPPRIAAVKSVPVRPPSSSPSTSTGST